MLRWRARGRRGRKRDEKVSCARRDRGLRIENRKGGTHRKEAGLEAISRERQERMSSTSVTVEGRVEKGEAHQPQARRRYRARDSAEGGIRTDDAILLPPIV